MFGGFFVCLLGVIIGIFPLIDGAVRFTQVPPPILYVSSGGTAKFVWDYHVDDRNSEFFTTSPEWHYSNSTKKIRIAADALTLVSNKFVWIWYLSPSCPARLKPRLSKESVATLVISNVSMLDNGNYSCSLVLRAGQPPIQSTVQLIVTVLISSPGPLTREVGQDVVFMVNSTAMSEATWGVRDGDTKDMKPRLIKVLNPGGVFPYSDSTGYAGRVSYVGDLSKGKAWFKITNLNISDTTQYMVKILQGQSSYRYRTTRLTVIQPATPVTTRPLQTTTGVITAATSSSQTSPRPTTLQVLQLYNRSISIKVVKESSGDFSNPSSAAYKNLSETFVSEIKSVYRNIDNFEKAKVTSLSENSIPVKFVVYFKSTIKPDEICAPLKDAVKDNRLGNIKIVPGSLGCSNEPSRSFPKNQSSSACTCTSIIATCVTIIIFLILVVVVLLIYIWRLKVNTGKREESRKLSSIQDKKLEAYENDHPMEDTITAQTARTPNVEKELYETINENRDKGTAAITANVKPTGGPSVGTQRDVPSLPQHYQELQRMAPNPTPLYEPLKQRDLGNKGELTLEVPKTYEQLQQSASGREYQSLKSYKADTESKV